MVSPAKEKHERTNCQSINRVFRDDERAQVQDPPLGQVRGRNSLGGYAAGWKLRVGALEAGRPARLVKVKGEVTKPFFV